MIRCFEFALNRPGLAGVRFLVWRRALAADGGVEDDFLADVSSLKRHEPGTGIETVFPAALAAPATTHLVVLRNPDIVLDPGLPGRIAETIDALPPMDDWSIAAPAGLGLSNRRYLSLYATAAPAIPETSGPQALLDPMGDLVIVNAGFARPLVERWAGVPDAALEPILALEGYCAGRLALFTPELTAGINGDLLSRDLTRMSAEISDHFGQRYPGQSVSTAAGPVDIARPDDGAIATAIPRKTGPLLSEAIDRTLKQHADALTISVVIRTRFDRLHLLHRLLASLSRTRLDGVDLEIILSSDHPPQTCIAQAESLRADFRALTIKVQPNASQGHSRVDNLLGGIGAARGDYVMVIDDDDYVDLFAFDAISKTLLFGHRPLIVIGANVHEEHWEQTPSGRWVLSQTRLKSHYDSSGWREMFGGINRLPICSLLVPRKTLQRRIEAFTFRHDLSEDYALFLLVLTDPALPAIVEVPDAVCHISVRGQENSVMMPDRMPWVRDITGYLTDLTSNRNIAGPGMWALLAAHEKRAADVIEDQTRDDLRKTLDRTAATIALLRRENDRLRRTHRHRGEPAA